AGGPRGGHPATWNRRARLERAEPREATMRHIPSPEVRMYCPGCGLGQPSDHRFCIACGSRLPPEPLPRHAPKITRWLPALPVHPEDGPETMLRVSRYLKEFDILTEDGFVRVPAHHVRFSIWSGDRALFAVSIPDDEADSLATFLASAVADGEGRGAPIAT